MSHNRRLCTHNKTQMTSGVAIALGHVPATPIFTVISSWTMWSTGRKQQWLTESQTVPPRGSRSPFTSARKVNKPQIATMAAINSAVYVGRLSWHDGCPSWQDPKEMSTSLLVIKSSEIGRNVKVSTLCLKKVPTFKPSVTLSNLNWFSKCLYCWKAYEIC